MYRRKNEASNVSSISQSMGTSTCNLIFPELTISPLRRFQLIDSDSDEPSKSEFVEKESAYVDSPLSGNLQHSGADFSCQRKPGPSAGTLKTKDLWEDFCSEKTFNIPTPVLMRGQFCHEGGSKKTSQKSAVVANSRKSRKKVKQPNSVEESQGSEMGEPKSSAVIPKRCRQEKGAGSWQISGSLVHNWRWAVYVAKNGREFSGQSAYRCYRKESETGFKKSTNKTAGKSKATSKKK
ncbi:hypothetical protein HAX54_010029 [Datura stramonium]|uniref:Uncharacterized protein n=1 Tax=Datura stramonium TaxID=4076 RepID=A0ABS8TH69_DATST|nr:hypothetical protein [Datura stramonium]